MSLEMGNRALYLVLILSILGILILLFATKSGIGLGTDSLHYIGASRSLLRGDGLTRISYDGRLIPMVDWPPLYPVLLAMLGAVGIDPLQGARGLNGLLFGANILLVGIVIYRQTNNSVWASLAGSFLMLTSVNMLRVHSIAMTEPAFIFFTVLGFALLASYIAKPKPTLLIASSVTIGLAFLTKYLGAVPVATGCIGLLVLSRKPFRRRLIDCITFGAISSFPMALWVVRNHMVADRVVASKMSFHPPTFTYIQEGLRNVSLWLVPERTPYAIMIFLPVGLTVLFALVALLPQLQQKKASVNNAPYGKPRIRPLLIIFIILHCLALAFSIAFVSVDISFSQRYLSPVYVMVVILVVCWIYEALRSTRISRRLKIGLITVSVLFAGYCLARDAVTVMATSRDGQGYASASWRQSETLSTVAALPADVRIYSNGYNIIYYLTGKPAYRIPAKFDESTGQLRDTYRSELDSIKEHPGSPSAVLVYFNNNYRSYLPSEEELRGSLPLRLIHAAADGSIYEIGTEQKLESGR